MIFFANQFCYNGESNGDKETRRKICSTKFIYFLNTGDIPFDATAPGLKEAREKLRLERMSKAELNAYYRHLDNVVILRDNIVTARGEGRLEGRLEGRAEGRAEGINIGSKKTKAGIAKQMKMDGMPMEIIMKYTGFTQDEIEKL